MVKDELSISYLILFVVDVSVKNFRGSLPRFPIRVVELARYGNF